MFNITLQVGAEFFHMMSIDVPPGVGAPHTTMDTIGVCGLM